MERIKTLEKLGFRGDVLWVHNEEGSGARYYGSSVYFPDDIIKPKSNSGVTIDPGLDLGHASQKLIEGVFNFYRTEGIINKQQELLIYTAVGKKKLEAAEWIIKYRPELKGKVLVPDHNASFVMAKYTAPEYWEPLVKAIPELLTFDVEFLKLPIHTALLSYSYNRGPAACIRLAAEYIRRKEFKKLAEAIGSQQHKMKSLIERRKRESTLIMDAVEYVESNYESIFRIEYAEINPMPVTTLSVIDKDRLLEEKEMVAVPENPRPKL